VVTEPRRVRKAIGVTGQFSAVDDLLTGEENLQMMADLRHLRGGGKRRVAELLEQFDLTEAARKPLATYSGGMRRKLDLAMTLVSRPQIVFLDEPTSGLDPRSRAGMWDIVRELVAAGTTILLTTQYLEEADDLADRIAVLDRGRIVAEGTPAELKRLAPGGSIQLEFEDGEALAAAALALGNGSADTTALTLDVPSDGGFASLRAIIERLEGIGVDVRRLSINTPDLDDVFFALTGHDAASVAGKDDSTRQEVA
jgi:ABC-2 type transport system ATP-binding protein